jgi:prolyl oligopeptidase
LIRIETNPGHGASNITKAIEVNSDICSFMFYNMGVTPLFKESAGTGKEKKKAF